MAHEEVGLIVSDPEQVILRVRSVPPAVLYLAHDYARVGCRGWHGRSDRRELAR